MQQFCLNINEDTISVEAQDVDSWTLPVESWTWSVKSDLDDTKIKAIDGEQKPSDEAEANISIEFKESHPNKCESEAQDKHEDPEEITADDYAPNISNILWAPRIQNRTTKRTRNDQETDGEKEVNPHDECRLKLTFDDEADAVDTEDEENAEDERKDEEQHDEIEHADLEASDDDKEDNKGMLDHLVFYE